MSPGSTCRRKRAPSSPPNNGNLPANRRVGQHRDRTHLGDGFTHQHAGQRRAAGKVPGEEPLVTGQAPTLPIALTPGSSATNRSTNKNGGRCGRTSIGDGSAVMRRALPATSPVCPSG